MNLFGYLSENIETSIVVGIILLLAGIFIFKIEGFALLLGKAVGMVLQQICSLVLEAVFLIFKIINAVEIYIVLLIDALTGKVNSNAKIATLAIGMLSIVSFYTTYTGMCVFINEDFITILITVGIQAILFSTSLRIGDTLALGDTSTKELRHTRIIFVFGLVCLLGCLIAYCVRFMPLSYSITKVLYHILYMLIIVSALLIIFLLIHELINAESTNRNAGIFLFIVYFSVLSVSSFFSYNSFVPVMYPDSIRNLDTFHSYKIGVMEILEQIQEDIDYDYYEQVTQELGNTLQNLNFNEEEISKNLSKEEQQIYSQKDQFNDYKQKQETLKQTENELKELEQAYENEKNSIYQYSGGIGPNTKTVLNNAKQKFNKQEEILNSEIKSLKNSINQYNLSFSTKESEYEKLFKKIEDYEKGVEQVQLLLKKDSLTLSEETQLREYINDIEFMRIKFQKKDTLSNNLGNMINVYIKYQKFLKQYEKKIAVIMATTYQANDLKSTKSTIQKSAYSILNSLPETKYMFLINNRKIQTNHLNISNYYNSIELLYRNTEQELSSIEKNIRTFVDNKLIGITCALLAILIDLMILFVGLILPKDINFWNKATPYTAQEKKRILSNLFNKPIKR